VQQYFSKETTFEEEAHSSKRQFSGPTTAASLWTLSATTNTTNKQWPEMATTLVI
jgi:hypothetical protein